MNHIATLLHQGYMDGLEGRDPQHEGSEDYEEGWLHGSKDRENGQTAKPFLGHHPGPYAVTKGDTVRVRKGTLVFRDGKWTPALRTFTVKVHHILCGQDAHLHYRDFMPPTPVTVVWAGSGSYWTEAALGDVEKV